MVHMKWYGWLMLMYHTSVESIFPLFIIVLIIVVVGTAYTFIAFAWQWLVYCPNRGPLRWTIGNTKVIAFMDAYHNPYNKDYRYWIGLLLLVRVVLYLVSSLNVLGDPRINLLSIAIVTVMLVFFQLLAEKKQKIHQQNINEMLERISLFNLAVLTIATLFITENKDSQNLVAYISTGIAFVTFLAILVYHVYQFVLTELFNKISSKLQGTQNQLILIDRTAVSATMTNEEPVSETEIDALPNPIDTVTMEEEELTTEDEAAEASIDSVPTASEHLQPLLSIDQPPTMTGSKATRAELESPTFISHSKPLKDQVNHLSPLASHMYIPASQCDKKTSRPVETELPNLASGCELLQTGDIFHPSAQLVEALDDENKCESFDLKENDSIPLLP